MITHLNILRAYTIAEDTYIKDAYNLHDVEVNQKYDDKPYSYHLKSVLNIAMQYAPLVVGKSEDIQAILFAAVYHDAIEDARLTYHDIVKLAIKYLYGDAVIDMATEIVYACTNEKGKNRDERANDKYYEGIRKTKYASFIKACDRIANMLYSWSINSEMYEKYKAERKKFLSSIDAEHTIPKEMYDALLSI